MTTIVSAPCNGEEYTFFIIQHKNDSGAFVTSNLDKLGPAAGFRASDDCWQHTRNHATYDESQALSAVAQLRQLLPDNTLRIARCVVKAEYSPVADFYPTSQS